MLKRQNTQKCLIWSASRKSVKEIRYLSYLNPLHYKKGVSHFL